MVLESTMICVDNSNFMRNGDFLPSRLLAQQDAVSLVCQSKTRSNPENNVGLLTLANVEVLATLTSDVGRVMAKLNKVEPDGDINLVTGIRIAHLALKHRQGKNHKMRIVAFVGSPVTADQDDLVRLAKRLKKEKVSVDLVSFGEDAINTDALSAFINALNGKEGGSSHLVTVSPGPHLSDALVSSPVIQGEGGAGPSGVGFEFGVDPNDDPELALALRVSMEEQRHLQEAEARRNQAPTSGIPPTVTEASSEEAMLERALAMSMEQPMEVSDQPVPDFATMTEEEQIAYAMRMSVEEQPHNPSLAESENMEADSEDLDDPAYVQAILESLPGVEADSDTVRKALQDLANRKKDSDDKPDES
uniref:26S proteasome non-ATPase regulatory subunit 4 n=1 Tax=Xenopsylla cheopis TaxID=163159 RepID=A0A6M2DS62_XENCH